jgi:hypothetical protein
LAGMTTPYGSSSGNPARVPGPALSRQKLIGWILIVVSAAYIAWFVRVRLFTAGPAVEKKEWLQAIGSIVILMLGTINVRLAAMRARSRDGARR